MIGPKVEGLRRIASVMGMLVSRDIAVLTNAVAFNFLLCLFPFILVLVAVAQQFPSRGRMLGALFLILQELIPFNRLAMAESLRGLTKVARGLAAVSLLLIVWGSSGIFIPVEMALNRAWGGESNRSFLRSRILAFVMAMAGGGLALVSVGLTVAARSYREQWPTLAGYGAKGSALLLTYFLFFLIYRFIPSAPVDTDVAVRAALWAGTSWEIAKYFFVIKLSQMDLVAFYGPLAFSVSLVLWAYVSSLMLVFGALMVPRASSRTEPNRRG